MQSRPEYSEITNQTLHNFFVNSSNVSEISVSCHDNPMDWDLANLVAICFFSNEIRAFLPDLGQELLCEQVRHLAERCSCPTGEACSLWLDLAAAWWHNNWRSLWPFRPQREVVYKTNIARLLFVSESQFNYLFTLKNAHLSSNSYNFWMQRNIAMKFAGYVAWILLCKRCKFGEKN